jgi:hypothetical protein
MLNAFILRAKWTRAKRRGKPPAIAPILVTRSDDLKVGKPQYLVAHLHLARCWKEQLQQEYEWFVASMRGELPPRRTPIKNYVIYHVNLQPKQYLMALETLTTKLGVKLNGSQPSKEE